VKYDDYQVADELFKLKHKVVSPLDIYALAGGVRSSLTHFEAIV